MTQETTHTTDAYRAIDRMGIARRMLAMVIRKADDAKLLSVVIRPTEYAYPAGVEIQLDSVEALDTLGSALGLTAQPEHVAENGSRHYVWRGTLEEPYNTCPVELRVCILAS